MEWKEYKLGDVIEIYDKQRKPLSSMQRKAFQGIYRYFGAQGVIDYVKDYIFDGQYMLIAEDGENLNSRKEPIAQIVDGKFWVNNHAHIIRTNEKANLHYIMWLLNSMSISAYVTGAVQPKLNQENLKNISITIPTRNIQDRIASILSSLDSKIETNIKINAKLEEMAQALFKSWFVDFEPFKDKGMVESELGMIPEGWRVAHYEDIVEETISGDWGKEESTGNYTHCVACIRGCDFQDMKNGVRGNTPQRFILEKNFNNKKMKDKDIIVEISGGTATVSTGRICYVNNELLSKYDNDIVCTNFCRVVRPISSYSAYIYYSWQYKYDMKVMFGYENGTSGIKNFSIKDFISREPVLIPTEDAVLSFQSKIEYLRKQIQINGSENTQLATLRDTLLPKLMSGEIEV